MLLNNSSQSNQSHNGSHSSDSKKQQASGGHRKNDSITSNSSSGAGSQFYCDINNLSYRCVKHIFVLKTFVNDSILVLETIRWIVM